MAARSLNKLDLQAMKVVWQLGKATVNDVLDTLDQKLAYTSVATTLHHLEKNGFVTHEEASPSAVHPGKRDRGCQLTAGSPRQRPPFKLLHWHVSPECCSGSRNQATDGQPGV